MKWASLISLVACFALAGCSEVGPTSPDQANRPNSVPEMQPQFSHSASENTGTFNWFFGQDFPLFAAGPSVSLAQDGSRIEISGTGSFSIGEGQKSISGGGTFQIFDGSNNLVASGNWTMEHLRGYVDYGGAGFNPDFRGGTLEAEIALDGLGKGSLWIFCLISTPPPPSKDEGVHVRIGPWHFDDSAAGGPTLFARS